MAAAPAASGAALTNPLGELGVKLVGTVNAGSPQDSSAVFEDAEQGISTHHIGDTVQPSGARLEEIGRQQAVLSYQGRRITLQVQAATAKAPRVASDQLTADELFQMPTAQLDRMLGSEEKRLAVDLAQAVRDLETMGQFSPAPQGSRGLSVESVQEGSPLAIVGLEPGDVILKVDGKPLRSKDDGLRVLAESLYSEGGSTVLSVRRLGSSMQIAMGSGALLPRDPAAATAR